MHRTLARIGSCYFCFLFDAVFSLSPSRLVAVVLSHLVTLFRRSVSPPCLLSRISVSALPALRCCVDEWRKPWVPTTHACDDQSPPSASHRYSLSLEEAGYAATDELVVFADGDGTMLTFDASHPLKVPASTSDAPVVMTMSPKLPSGWRVLGEFDKWIRVSPQRFADITSNATKMTVHIRGGRAGEEVTFLVVSPQGTVIPTWCKIASDGAEAVATIYASDLSGNC